MDRTVELKRTISHRRRLNGGEDLNLRDSKCYRKNGDVLRCNTSEAINPMIDHISKQLYSFNAKELEHIKHVLLSLKASKKGGLYYFGRFLGIDFQEDGNAKMHLGLHNANTYGVAQGGAIYTLADIAIGYRILTNLPKNEKVYTQEMKINYIKPGKGDILTAQPEIMHRGRNTVIGQCRIEDETGDLVAQSLGTFFIVR